MTDATYFSVFSTVGSKSGLSSDTSPPLQSFTEESSPENLVSPPLTARMVNGQSTESLDSFSDESGGHQIRHPASGTRRPRAVRSFKNPVPPPRKVDLSEHFRGMQYSSE